MTKMKVFRVSLESDTLLLAAVSPHHLDALLRDYELEDDVVDVCELGSLANVNVPLDDGH